MAVVRLLLDTDHPEKLVARWFSLIMSVITLYVALIV